MFCLGYCYENHAFHYDGENYAGKDIEKIDQISLSGIADSTMILKARKEYSELELKLKNAEVREITSRESFKNIFNISSIQKLDLLKPKEIKSYKYHESSMIKNSPILNGQRSVIKSLDISKASLEAQKKPNISLKAGDEIMIRKTPDTISLIHPMGYDFFAACRKKLGWSSNITLAKS